jgi:hypothetical protein
MLTGHETGEIWFAYDGECPICTYAAQARHASLACPQMSFTYGPAEDPEVETFYRCAQRYGMAELDVRSELAIARFLDDWIAKSKK